MKNLHVNDDEEFESKLISVPINLDDLILIFEAIPGTPGNLW